MSSSTPRSRRTRNSTVQSVDLLNRINASAPNTALPRPRVRTLNKKQLVPRSDDVYSVPSPSPEAEHLPRSTRTASSAPGTRRSTRVQKQDSPSQARPTRNLNKGPRSRNRSPEIRIFSGSSDADTDGPGKQPSRPSSIEDGGPPDVGLFGRNNRDMETRDVGHGNANYGTSNTNGIEQAPSEDDSDDSAAAQALGELRVLQNDWEPAPDENTYTENQDPPESTELPHKRKQMDILQASTADPGPETEPDLGGNSDTNLGEREGELSPETGEEFAPSSHNQPQKRSRTESHPRPGVYVEIPARRPKSPTPPDDNQPSDYSPKNETSPADQSQNGSPALGSPDSSLIPETVPEVADGGAENGAEENGPEKNGAEENEARQGDFGLPLFKEARNLGRQKENWEIFKDQTMILERRADHSLPTSFEAPGTLISALGDAYGTMRDELSEGRGIPTESIKECENLLRGISAEGFQILDRVWRYCEERQQDQANVLLWDFETQVIPPMCRLTTSCFLAYYVGQGRFQKRHLYKPMDVLCSWCEQIQNLWKADLIKRKVLSRNLRLALRRLISALSSGLINVVPPEPSRIDRHARPFGLLEGAESEDGYFSDLEVPIAPRKWTVQEGKTLLEGLSRYQGMDTYYALIISFPKTIS